MAASSPEAIQRAIDWNKNNKEKRAAISRRYRARHYEKSLAQQKIYRNSAHGKAKNTEGRLRRTFGLSVSEYNQMYCAQGGKCAICHQPETRMVKGQPTQLAVDHDHETGQVRKLLCHACNVSLGLLQENTDRMLNMVAYVESF